MISMAQDYGTAFLSIRAPYVRMVRNKKEIKRLEKEIEEGLARGTKIRISS